MKIQIRFKANGAFMAKQQRRRSKKGSAQLQAKKWKGKDWFDIVSPQDFGGKIVYQTPSTDPKTLIGRNVLVPISDLTDDRSKYYMWLKLKIAEVDGKSAKTIINGFQCMNEYLSRNIRKRREKIEITHVTKTKDGWKIRVKPLLIMNRNVSSSVKTSAIKMLMNLLDEKTKSLTITDFTKELIKGTIQNDIKKSISKIYPVRFAQISKIKVLESAYKMDVPESPTEKEDAEDSEKK